MSENAQTEKSSRGSCDTSFVRAAALHGPITYALQKELITNSQLTRLAPGFYGLDNPEAKLDFDTFLLCLDRLDWLERSEDLIVMAALSQDFASLGLFGKCLVHAENLWGAIDSLRHVVRYFQSDTDITIRIRRGKVKVFYSHPFEQSRAAQVDVRYAISLLYKLVCEAKWSRSAKIEVGFPGARKLDTSIFSFADRLSESSIGFVEFDEILLTSPMIRSDPFTSETLNALLVRLSSENKSEATLQELIKAMQFVSLRKHHIPISLKQAAQFLSMPERTLQAALSAEKTSFRNLRDSARHSLAKQALQSGKSIMETTHLVGFNHRQSFSEAFSLWEGCSPSEFVSISRS
ncbi:MAG: helix-turn-helix domain-containing protein [Paracoccaceae bacterium]